MPQPAALAAFLRWLKNNDEEELLAFIHAVVYNGGRRLDIGIQWPDVDFDEGVVTYVGRAVIIAKGDTDSEGQPCAAGEGREEVFVRATPTKKRKPRVAALTPEGIAALRRHHAKAMEMAFDCGIALAPDAYVFSHEADGSQPVRPDFFTKRFRIAREACGIPGMQGVRLYDCRHALITQLKAERVPDSVIAERCGNSERTMDQKYRQRIDPADKAAAVALSRAMREAEQPPE
jgi:integrase